MSLGPGRARPGELRDRTYTPGECPWVALIEYLGPWIRLQRTSTLSQLCQMLAAEVQRREIPLAHPLFEVATELERRSEAERVAR